MQNTGQLLLLLAGLTWEGDYTMWIVAALAVLVWARGMYIMTVHPHLGPLILMIFEMKKDITNFIIIAAIFVMVGQDPCIFSRDFIVV